MKSTRKLRQSIRPTFDYVLIQLIEDADCFPGSGEILLPGKVKKPPMKATVIAVGPGRWSSWEDGEPYFKKPQVRPGDVVLIPRECGTVVHRNIEDLRFIFESDVLATVTA